MHSTADDGRQTRPSKLARVLTRRLSNKSTIGRAIKACMLKATCSESETRVFPVVDVQTKAGHGEGLGHRSGGQHVLGNAKDVKGSIFDGHDDEQRDGQQRRTRIEELAAERPRRDVEANLEEHQQRYCRLLQTETLDEKRVDRREYRVADLAMRRSRTHRARGRYWCERGPAPRRAPASPTRPRYRCVRHHRATGSSASAAPHAARCAASLNGIGARAFADPRRSRLSCINGRVPAPGAREDGVHSCRLTS